MRLAELLDGVAAGMPEVVTDLDVGEVREDSRAVQPGDLFVAVKGQTVDGHRYLEQAAKQGAAAVVVEEDVSCETTVIRVASTRAALARIAANRYGRPAEKLKLVGVTGTNGKTTTAFLSEALTGGGVIGTVVYRYKEWVKPAPFTTPGPLELHATFAEMLALGCTHVSMECSSHALELGRLDGVRFDVAAFTNLTQDHLDFHGTMEKYRDAKALLFTQHLRGAAVVNLQSEYGPWFAQLAPNTIGVGRDVRVVEVTHSLDGIDARVATPVGEVRLKSPLIGAFNLENLMVGVGIGVGLGMDAETIGARLSSVRGVPGRLERVPAAGFGVFVDYAHTPDALERVMAAVRPLTTGRLIVVFGCGGDRDRTKRPKMGRAVAEMADLPIVTSDNPRTEEPNSIIEMIVAGMTRPAFLVEADRHKAIVAAMTEARPGDAVVIAGKGHEDYQIVGKTKHHFDDREEARAALQKLATSDGKAQS
jgi:UDP-N-acetylmuramoyl-L-alanyl-D-glutamate--2,6-diaminopimelate ligase